MRRGIVSPSTRSITNPWPRSSSGPSSTRTRGTGTPAAAVASSSMYSVARSDHPVCIPGSRRSTSPCRVPPDAMRSALGVHDELLRQAIEAHGGYVFSTAGDAFAAAFGRAADAVGAAVDGQRALQSERWPGGIFLRVRMGIHTGEAVERDGDYFGPTLNRAARLMAIGHGGQVLVSSTTAAVLGNTDGLLKDLGDHRLRD